jgi:hypothetical protein
MRGQGLWGVLKYVPLWSWLHLILVTLCKYYCNVIFIRKTSWYNGVFYQQTLERNEYINCNDFVCFVFAINKKDAEICGLIWNICTEINCMQVMINVNKWRCHDQWTKHHGCYSRIIFGRSRLCLSVYKPCSQMSLSPFSTYKCWASNLKHAMRFRLPLCHVHS